MSEMFRKKSNKNEPQIDNPKQVVKALEVLFASKFIDKKTLYLHNFLRGIAIGAGTVIGATVVIGVIIWILSLFDSIPFIGPVVDNIQQSIEENR
jgi:hypothetical protein